MNLNYLEDIKDIHSQTTDLVEESKQFAHNAEETRKAAWWYNKKYQVLVWGSVILVALLAILFVYKLV